MNQNRLSWYIADNKYIGLYEKYDWKYMEQVNTFRSDSPIARLYKLNI